ncbi:zinc finger BED domain-containing protein RICESLEEPER 2 [Tanacetum coccineum]
MTDNSTKAKCTQDGSGSGAIVYARDGSVFVYNPDAVREQFTGFPTRGVELLIESISTDLECFDDGFATKAKELFSQSFQVQATSVASESAFSTSGRVLSIRRTRLTPASLEMCMCLKDHLDATDRTQHTSTLENCLDFEEEILEEEVQDNEAIALSDEEIALDEAASDARSNGSGFGGEDVDLTLSESD